ncbi:hypothetical protein F5051DRAFT_434274 [Lentinula edodes]|nr:hypothetical protein F5051DRAFT_434274 [Lentinula edodes]
MQTVGQAEDMAKVLETPEHISRNECECRNCVRAAEENGCQHPHDCFTRAKALLDTLEPKWDPRTPSQEEEDMEPITIEGWCEVDTRMTTSGKLSNAMRIFTDGSAGKIPAEVIQRGTTQPDEVATTITIAATEERQREEEALSAVGVIIDQRHQSDTLELKTPRRVGTDRQAAELFGILKVIESTDQNQAIKIELASKDTVDLLSNKIQDVEDKGYLGIKNADIIKKVMTGA